MIVAAVVICAVIGAASTLFSSEEGKERTYYKATHSYFYDRSFDSGVIRSAFSNIEQVAVFATIGDVPKRVAETLATDESARQLVSHIIVTINSVTNTLEITAADPDSDQAVLLADTFGEELMDSLLAKDQAAYTKVRDDSLKAQNDLRAQIAVIEAQLAASPNSSVLQAQRNALGSQFAVVYERFQQIAAAPQPSVPFTTLEDAQSVPISQGEYDERIRRAGLGENVVHAGSTADNIATPGAAGGSSLESPVSRGLLGAFLGLLAGVGMALLLDRLDRRIRTRDDAETAFGLPVLAEVPTLSELQRRSREIVLYTHPLSPAAEAYRAVRSSLLFQHAAPPVAAASSGANNPAAVAPLFESDGDPLVIMVTSAAPSEGKTTTSANLAAAFAETDMSVLVINCDFRRPAIHHFFGVPDEPRRIHDTLMPNVKIVTSVLSEADVNPAQAIAAQRQVVAAARNRFDVVILDTPPLLAANDAVELVSVADLVLLVAFSESTTTTAAQRATEMLTRVGAPLSGLVLVAVGEGASGSQYYYYYGNQTAPAKAPAPSEHRNGSEAAERLTPNGVVTEQDLFPSDVNWSDEPKPTG